MEVIGSITSVTGVVGFVAQIAGGCKAFKGIIFDIKNAPQDIKRLAEGVKATEEISNEVLRQYEQLRIDYGLRDIPAAGALQLAAIKELEPKISSSAKVFDNLTPGSKKKTKHFWRRLKYAENKEEIEVLMKWVNSTTQQVALVRQNLSRYGKTPLLITSLNIQKAPSHLLTKMPTITASKTAEIICDDLLPIIQDIFEKSIEQKLLDIAPKVHLLDGRFLQRDLLAHLNKLTEQH